jgi:hypothetical protein
MTAALTIPADFRTLVLMVDMPQLARSRLGYKSYNV